jgi:hypothetical protein
MSTQSALILHPLAIQDKERIDILFGGAEADALKESLALSRDILNHSIGDEEEILYINTLVSIRSFETHWRRALKEVHQNWRFRAMTLLDDELVHKLKFLTKTIEEKKMRYVILNGFEFAAMTPRHRIQIFSWLKSLRDKHGMSVTVFTQSGPRSYGTLGQMRFLSETCEMVGSYLRKNEEAKPSEEEVAPPKPKTESEIFEAKIKKHPDGTPKYFADKVKLQWLRDKESAAALLASVAIDAATDASQEAASDSETLKTKELEVENVNSELTD